MAVLGGGKKRKLKRTKNKKETVTINADGSKTVTVTKNKTRTRETQPTKRATRKVPTSVSTLKPYGITKQKVKIPNAKITSKPIKAQPKLSASQLSMRDTVRKQVAANKKEEQWQSVVRNSQPLSTSPTIPNRKATFPKRRTRRQISKERQKPSTYYLN